MSTVRATHASTGGSRSGNNTEESNSSTAFPASSLDDSGTDFFDKFLQDNNADMGLDDFAGGNNSFRATTDDTDPFLAAGNSSLNGSMSLMMDFPLDGAGNSSHNSATKFPSNHSAASSQRDGMDTVGTLEQSFSTNHLEPPSATKSSASSSNAEALDGRPLHSKLGTPSLGAIKDGDVTMEQTSNASSSGPPRPYDTSPRFNTNNMQSSESRPPCAPFNNDTDAKTKNIHISNVTGSRLNSAGLAQRQSDGNANFASILPQNASSLSMISHINSNGNNNNNTGGTGGLEPFSTESNRPAQDVYDMTLGASPLECMPSLPTQYNTQAGMPSPLSHNSQSISPFDVYKAKKLKQQQQQSNAMFHTNSPPPSSLGNGSSVFNNMATSQLKSTMSDGMLARTLKEKYNRNGLGGTSGQAGAVNAAFPVNNSRNLRMSPPGFNRVTGLPRNAVSSVALSGSSRGPIAASISRSKLRHAANSSSGYLNSNSRSRLADIELSDDNAGGQKNATWGGGTKRSNSALFAKLLSSKGMKKDPSKLVSTKSSSSISKLLASKRHSSRNLVSTSGGLGAGGSSSASINEYLRGSKKLTKTQSLLRQSSQQSLSKRRSFQNLTSSSGPGKVDLSFLLPPSHSKSPHSATKQRKEPSSSAPPGCGGLKNSTFPVMRLADSATIASKTDRGSDDAISTDSSLLHQSCRLYPTTAAVVESAVRIDPSAVRRAVAVSTMDKGRQNGGDVYGYPINIAMKYGATPEVVRILAKAGPDVLVQRDGHEGMCSLAIAIQAKCDPTILQVLCQVNPKCVEIPDRRANTPLHTAVSSGAALPIVKQLYQLYPKALEARNFNSLTPLDIAQQSTRCSETVMNFLQSSAFSPVESRAYRVSSQSYGGPTKAKNFGMASARQNNGLMSMNGRSFGQNNPSAIQVTSSLEEGLDDIMEANL